MSKKAFLVVMQEWNQRDWENVGSIQMVEADDTQAGAVDVAIDFALDNDPGHDEWRVMAWEDVQDGFTLAAPDSTIYPRDLPKGGAAGVIRKPQVRKHRPRTQGPVFECVRKVPACKELALSRIMITDDPRNAAGKRFPGTSWYVAQAPENAVAAVVQGWGSMTWRGEEVFSLHTLVGEVRMVPGQPVILVDDI
jgi:hypothetical protein